MAPPLAMNDEQPSFSAAERAQPAIGAVCAQLCEHIGADSAVPPGYCTIYFVRSLSGRLHKKDH